eukprot:TRINITY_DN875_c0_g1_i2.p1 TRINITY_DN875_c0_g1~~TRINITY_DN875_c0_g1_i2.p1  ORF type:complete len:777 (+),score=257.67 TRINITY_DN875_c0_g1_i2:522-2852(+)
MRGLSTLKQLRSVVLTANNIEKIEGTKGLGNLHTLLLDSNQITQMSKSLTNLTSLTVLDLSSNSIQKMENLYNGRQLEILMLNNNGIRVVEGLRSCKGLQELHLSNNKIAKKLADLTQVPYLKILKLNSNRVADFSTFPVMKNLQELHLADNRISDLRNLAGKKKLFPKLEMMDLSENTVAHLSSLYLDKTLAEMPELMEVRLAGNPLIRKQPKYAKEVFQLLPQVDYVDNFEFDQQGNVFAAQASESQYQQPQPSQPQRQQQHQHQPSSRNQVTHAQDDQFQQFMQTVEDPLDDDAINDFKRQLQEMVSGDGQPTIQNPQQGSQSSQGSKISKSRPVSALHQQQKLEPVMGDNQLDNNVIDFREACESLRTKIAQELDALNNVETMSTLNVGDVLDPMGGDDDYLFEDVEDGEEYQYDAEPFEYEQIDYLTEIIKQTQQEAKRIQQQLKEESWLKEKEHPTNDEDADDDIEDGKQDLDDQQPELDLDVEIQDEDIRKPANPYAAYFEQAQRRKDKVNQVRAASAMSGGVYEYEGRGTATAATQRNTTTSISKNNESIVVNTKKPAAAKKTISVSMVSSDGPKLGAIQFSTFESDDSDDDSDEELYRRYIGRDLDDSEDDRSSDDSRKPRGVGKGKGKGKASGSRLTGKSAGGVQPQPPTSSSPTFSNTSPKRPTTASSQTSTGRRPRTANSRPSTSSGRPMTAGGTRIEVYERTTIGNTTPMSINLGKAEYEDEQQEPEDPGLRSSSRLSARGRLHDAMRFSQVRGFANDEDKDE